jgi:hypothetical protein
MYSPFPGMDPYLERSDRWSGVHAGMIAVLREILTRLVAPGFFVDSEDNVYILDAGDPARVVVRPDIYLVDAGHGGSPSPARGRATAPLLLDLPIELEIRAPYLRIIDTANRQVVTTVEVLSPINKVQGSSGQRDFLRKRDQVLHSDAHWLEIDLLRAGARLADIPQRSAYAALLHRAGASRLEAWIAGLRDPLPTINVPLREPLADVLLDLQEMVETVYDRYRYDTAINYEDDPPPPPLPGAESRWLRERIEAWQQTRTP